MRADQPSCDAVPLVELVVAASLASDLAKGLPSGQALRTCLIAGELGAAYGLTGDELETTFYVSLLRFIGCTATAPEMASALGDEIAISAAFSSVDARDLGQVLRTAFDEVGSDLAPLPRFRALAGFLSSAPRVIREHEVASCEVARLFAARIGLGESVQTALGQVFERYDGRGNPGLAGGEELGLPVRVEHVAFAAELVWRTSGEQACLDVLRKRAGSVLDPRLVAVLVANREIVDRALTAPAVLQDVLASAPARSPVLRGEALDDALAALGVVADMKSVGTRGHADAVARTAAAAARAAGCGDAEIETLRRAGWVHDLGRIAVSSRVWCARRRLTEVEWEQVRLHPYLTERVLARVPSLAGLARVAGSHHERVDGTGYHRGLLGAQTSRLATLLACSDVAVAMAEPRAYRQAMDVASRTRVLRKEAEGGRLPMWAVDAVLASGAAPARPRHVATRLTERENEVLRLLGRGASNRAIAVDLGISPKTVNSHLEHIYGKLGISTRAAAAYHAAQQGLLT